MAEAIGSYVLSKIDGFRKEYHKLNHLSDEIEPLQQDLSLILAFLKDADSKRKRNNFVKQWVNQVRQVAYRIEDIIDTFVEEIEGSHSIRKRKRCREDLENIHKDLKTLYEHRISLGVTQNGDNTTGENEGQVPFRPSKLHDIPEVVGLDSDKDQIIQHLLDRSISRRTVLSIVGIGGLGKTTLAQKVYQSTGLERQFDCRAWLSISQKFNLDILLKEILYSIDPQKKNMDPPITDEALPRNIMECLSTKKYLIALDDVWTIDLWEQLKRILPSTHNGSRVLITTRSRDVAVAADRDTTPYELGSLKEEESRDLLFRTAFQQHIQPANYPTDLMEVANRLIKKCCGLPLALIVLGGILSRRESTYSAWNKVERTMDWHNEDGEKCMKILAMSYEDLPYYLKLCFLYFASYPEDHIISAKQITKMWVAEGFIPKDGRGSMEDRAENYLEELVQRCLVQVTAKSLTGYCKYCRMHDLLRELAIHEAKEDNFFTVLAKAEYGVQQGLATRDLRRLALQFCTSPEIPHYNIRSLICFGQYISNYSNFTLLRVLTIERVDMSKKEISFLEGLIRLRYLSFRYCERMPHGFKKISFSSLKNLETLEFKDIKQLDNYGPNHSLWEVPTLRHVISTYSLRGPTAQTNLDQLENLQTLKWVSLQNFPARDQGCNLMLRKIGLYLDQNSELLKQCDSAEQAWEILKSLLRRMELLEYLAVWVDGYRAHLEIPFGPTGTSCLPCHEQIQSLWLRGKWPTGVALSVGMFPTNLTKFTLCYFNLQQDPMPILEMLQSLRILRLWDDSYMGKELSCSTRGFPKLQKLEICFLPNLCRWNINDGAMPTLNHLKINGCLELRVLPELQKLPTLQHLIVQTSSELYNRMQSEDVYKIEHIPLVHSHENF